MLSLRTCCAVTDLLFLGNADITAADELKLVRDYGIKDGSSVTVEQGSVAATPDACLLRCIPVFGNDTAEKFNPKLPGTRINSLCAEISFRKTDNESIEQVRHQFLTQINDKIRDLLLKSTSAKEGYLPSEHSNSPLGIITEFNPENCRLRVTNWAEEAIELPLSELNSEKQPVLLHQVVGTGLIKNRTTLLLELGKPSVPGFCELEVRMCYSKSTAVSLLFDSFSALLFVWHFL